MILDTLFPVHTLPPNKPKARSLEEAETVQGWS